MTKEDASTTDDGIVSKGKFAKLIRVSAGRVSQYISEGKISADCLVGEGRMARIDVAKAKAALNDTLDISQRLGNGIDTQIDVPTQPDLPSAPQQPASQRVEDKIKHEKLLQAQRANRRAAEDDALRNGKLMLTSDARQQMDLVASQMMQTFEGSITDMAAAVSAKFKLPHRDVVHCMRLAFAEVRARSSKAAANQADDMPKVVEAIIDQEVALQ